MTLMQDAAFFLSRSLGTAAATTVTYTVKASGVTGTITDSYAGGQRTTADSNVGQYSGRLEANERQRMFKGASLLAAVGVSKPAEGDTWTETTNGTATTYEVKPVSGEPAVTESDSAKTIWRARGKRVVT
jgi:hypothetical protein